MEGVDIVFHQAAIRITHCAEDPRLAHDVLATGTFNVLEAAVDAKVKRVVSASSASIYGQAEEFPTTEKHHGYGNRTIYGAAKIYGEGLLRSFHEMYGLELCRAALLQRLRSAHGCVRRLYRGHDSLDGAAGERSALPDPGRRRQTMDFVFVTDIARANSMAAHSSITDDVLNVASGTETSLNELAAISAVSWASIVRRNMVPPGKPPRSGGGWRMPERRSGRLASRPRSRSRMDSASLCNGGPRKPGSLTAQ